MKMGMLSMIFPNSLFIPLTENNLLAGVSTGSVTQILHYVFQKRQNCQFGSTIIMRVCLNVFVVASGSQWVAHPESAPMVFINLTLCLPSLVKKKSVFE